MARSSAKNSQEETRPTAPTTVLNFAPGSYLASTSQPLYALLFLLPLIAVYELGTILVNTQQIAETVSQRRVVAFVWLEWLAELVGFKQGLAWMFPGFVVVLILLCWHLSSRYSWRIKAGWLGWMALECAVLSVPLFALSAVMNRASDTQDAMTSNETTMRIVSRMSPLQAGGSVPIGTTQNTGYPANLVTSIGAGIYEELVFRLICMGLLLLLLEDVLKLKGPAPTIVAVLLSAGLFAAHHYVGIANGAMYWLEPFGTQSFLFRSAAGIYFAVIFRYRGYGVTAGAHAAYNIILYTLQ